MTFQEALRGKFQKINNKQGSLVESNFSIHSVGLFYWAKSFSCSDAPTVWFGRFGQIVLSNRGFGQFWQSITELRTLIWLFFDIFYLFHSKFNAENRQSRKRQPFRVHEFVHECSINVADRIWEILAAYFEGRFGLVRFCSFGNERLKWSVWVLLAKVCASLFSCFV